MNEKVCQLTSLVRLQNPLVLNITNYVAMNNSANALLAIGASPIMSNEVEEMEDLAKICASLVINIGTIEKENLNAILSAQKEFNKLNKPIVLDPVGAGASKYRNEIIKKILTNGTIQYIRGNASEIISLAGFDSYTRGVDSANSSVDAIQAARQISLQYHCTVCISGQTDVIISSQRTAYIHNGSILMTKVTALGCSASAVLGAYAALQADSFEAAIAACTIMSVCGEIAVKNSNGPGSLQMNLLDKLHDISNQEIITISTIEVK